MIGELKDKIKKLEKKLKQLKVYLRIDERVKTIKDVEAEISKPDFWTDSKRAEKLIGELKSAKAINEPYAKLLKRCKETEELLDIVEGTDRPALMHWISRAF
jgi:peptide chain release factor 2